MGVNIKCFAVNIREDRNCITEQAAIGGGYETEGSGYNPVTRTYSGSEQCNMKSRRTTVYRYCIPGADIICEGVFKLFNSWALGQLPGFKNMAAGRTWSGPPREGIFYQFAGNIPVRTKTFIPSHDSAIGVFFAATRRG